MLVSVYNTGEMGGLLYLLLLWVHSGLRIGVRATRGRCLARILITIGIMPANTFRAISLSIQM